jgi:putative FmdB family regulatory protein
MPTYEYECRSCGYSFERVQSMSEEAIKDCPECGKEVRRLIFGGSGIIFKGSGFYVNDSRGKNPAAPSGGKPSTAGSDASSSSSNSGGGSSGASSGGSEQKKAPASPNSGTASSAGSSAAVKTSSKD